MKTEEILKIGNLVEVEVLENGAYQGIYLSKIKDLEENKIYFSLPVEKGHVVPLRKGERVNINIVQKDGVYYFGGNIISRGLEPYMYFNMEYPEKLNRIQRRNYVRIILNLIVDFKILSINEDDENEEICRGVTINLSGGGMFIATPKKLELGREISAQFKLTNGFDCKIKGIIRRQDYIEVPSGKKAGYGIEFTEIEAKTRENIISYLFELQRDRRKKGIEI